MKYDRKEILIIIAILLSIVVVILLIINFVNGDKQLDQCQIDLKEQRAEWLWVREQLVICNAENDGLKFAIEKGMADSSDACYTAQGEVLVFLDQAIKNMDSFYCSEVLRTDEAACNIMDAYFVIIENRELMYEGCYPE